MGYNKFLLFLCILLIGISVVAPPAAASTYYLSNYNSYLTLLMHYNNSVPYTDEMQHTLTSVGAGPNSTGTPPKFGTGAACVTVSKGYSYITSGQSDFAFGSNPFTISMWLNATSAPNSVKFYDSRPALTNGNYMTIGTDASAHVIVDVNAVDIITSTQTLTTNTWNQVVVERSGGTTTLYINGAVGGSAGDGTVYLNEVNRPAIGTDGSSLGSNGWPGTIDEVAVWNNYAVPIGELYPQPQEVGTVQVQTYLWQYQPYLVALLNFNSSTLTYDDTGNTVWVASGSPLNTSVAVNKKYGLSAASFALANSSYISGSGTSSPQLTFGTGSWTIMFWFNTTGIATETFIDFCGAAAVNQNELYINYTGSQYIQFGNASTPRITSPIPYTTNFWHQVIVEKNATTNTTTMYVDGLSNGSFTDTGTYNVYATNSPVIGNTKKFNSNMYYTGYLDSIAIWNGVAIPNSTLYSQPYEVNQYPPLISNFVGVPTYGLTPLTVQFNDTSTGDVPTAWDWGWGDGTANGTAQNMTHTYTVIGNYTVYLNATGSQSYNRTTKVGYITAGYALPSAGFTANVTTGDQSLPVQFNDTSTGNVTAWNWTWGDGNQTIGTQNPVWTYTKAGSYNVTLNATNPAGSSFINKKGYITVLLPGTPNAGFTWTPNPAYPGSPVQFTDTSTVATTTSWNWSFGDGTISNQQNPLHIFSYAGIWPVNLTVGGVTGSGNTSITQQVTISTSATSTTWFTPHSVIFLIMDANSVPQPNQLVSENLVNSSFPGGTVGLSNYIQNVYGTSSTTAAYLSSNLTGQGYTGPDGKIVFIMNQNLAYNITIGQVGSSLYYQLPQPVYPQDSYYSVYLPPILSSGNPVSMMVANSTAAIVYACPVISNLTGVDASCQYRDPSGLTSDVRVQWFSAQNNTWFKTVDLGNPGTGTVYANLTQNNVNGESYVVQINASRNTP